MENIEESQNATNRIDNGKVMMKIAGVLFMVLAVVQLINGFEWRNSGYYIYHHNYIFLYRYIDIVLLAVEIIFSIACIIQKTIFFSICSLIISGIYLARAIYYTIYQTKVYVGETLVYSFEDSTLPILANLCLAISFVIIFLLILAQKKNKRKLIAVGRCIFVIPLIAYIALHYKYFIYFYYKFCTLSKYDTPYLIFGRICDYLQQILLIAGIFILSLSLIITPKKLNVPVSSTAYGKSYKSLVPHVLLLLFTCGIYYLVWIYRTTDSLNACKNEEYRTPVNKLLLCMFVPFYSIYWTYKSAHRIDTLGYEKGIQGETATLSLILSLFVPILPPILMQSKLNSVIMADSVSPAVATAMQYAAKPVDNGYNDLEKLKELYDKGVITEEEFTEKKKQVLGI